MFWMLLSSSKMSLARLHRSRTSLSLMHSQFFSSDIYRSRSEILLLKPEPRFRVTKLSLAEWRRGIISPSDPPLLRAGIDPAGGIVVGIIMTVSGASLCGTVLASKIA